MFTGLVWSSCPIKGLTKREGLGAALTVQITDERTKTWNLGDSIAINGVCLTIVNISPPNEFSFEVSPETLSCTTFSHLKVGSRVHVEPAMSLGDKIGGHLVSGHVDGVAPLFSKLKTGDFWKLEFELKGSVRNAVSPYLVPKGSVCVDGVSLTVNEVMDNHDQTIFSVMIIPHTFEVTNLGILSVGDFVNLEADLVAKYVSRSSRYYVKSSS